MEIETRGVPPFTVFSAELIDIRKHPWSAKTFLQALEKIYEQASFDDKAILEAMDDAYLHEESIKVISP